VEGGKGHFRAYLKAARGKEAGHALASVGFGTGVVKGMREVNMIEKREKERDRDREKERERGRERGREGNSKRGGGRDRM
jgi:hypothetical protein